MELPAEGAPRRSSPGGQPLYSDLAIELVLALRLVFHLVLDSTGLELFGQGEWDAEKHGRLRRQWRKLHLAVDAGTGEFAAHVLTDGHADDVAQLPGLLGQAEGVIASVMADGAYDGEPTYAAAAARQCHPLPEVVVPPRSSVQVQEPDRPQAARP